MKTCVLGIDIGGTKIEGVAFDGKKAVRGLTIVTPKTLKDFEYSLLHLIEFLSSGLRVSGIGIGVAGLVHPDRGTVEASPNLPYFKNFNLVKFLAAKGHKNVKIQNDAKCFALAESVLGQAKGRKDVLCVTLGTGIGSGIIIDGKLYGGFQNGAGEIGHGFLTNDADWESLYQQAKKDGARTKSDHDFKTIGNLLGKALAAACYTLDPELVVIGGGLARLYHREFLPRAVALGKKHMALGRFFPKVVVSRLTSASALGAALLVSSPKSKL